MRSIVANSEKVKDYFAEDAVFLHDKVPPLVGRSAIADSIKQNLCGKVVRELVPGTLEVHPLKEYGVVEIGVHRFLHPFSQDQGSWARRSSSTSGSLRAACGASRRSSATTTTWQSDGRPGYGC